jgi:hypothetical protein
MAAPSRAMAKYHQLGWPSPWGTAGWVAPCSSPPQSGCSRHRATAVTTRASPSRPKAFSMRSNLTRQMTSHTQKATTGIHSR